MQKRICTMLGLLILFLTACTPPLEITDDHEKDKPIEIPDEAKDYRFKLSTSNFENFFNVSFKMDITSETTYDMNDIIEPRFEFEATNIDALIRIGIMNRYESIPFETSYTFDYHVNEVSAFNIESEVYDLNQAPYISSYVLEVRAGEIKTKENMNLDLYSYPLRFDNNFNAPFNIGDMAQNEATYNDFIDLLTEINEGMDNHISLTTLQASHVYQGGEVTSQIAGNTVRMQGSPYYMDVTMGDETMVVHKLDNSNDYVSFLINPLLNYEDTIRIDPELISIEAFNDLNNQFGDFSQTDLSQNYNFDYKHLLFEEIDRGFLVKGYMRFFLSPSEYQMIKSLYQQMGLQTSILESTIVNLTLKAIDGQYIFTTDMMLNFIKPIDISIHSSVLMILDYNQFTPMLVTDDAFLITPKSSIDEVFLETNPFEVNISTLQSRDNYYKVKLDKGRYIMHLDNINFSFDILDASGHPTNQFITYGDKRYQPYKDIFVIPEAGYYYFKVNSKIMLPKYEFYIEKLDDVTEALEPKVLSLGANDIEIHSTYDLDYFILDAATDVVLEFTTDNQAISYIYVDHNQVLASEFHILLEAPNFKTWRYFEKGLHHIYFNSDEALETTLHVKDYGALSDRLGDIDLMRNLTDEFLESPVLLGPKTGRAYFRLDALHGIYSFEAESSSQIPVIGFELFDAQTNQFMYRFNLLELTENPLFIQTGSYYLMISSLEYQTVNIKFNHSLIDESTKKETLQTIENVEDMHTSIPSITGHIVYNKQIARHSFTLDDAQTILIDQTEFNHKLYNHEGQLLTFKHLIGQTNYILYELDSGTYEVEIILKDENLTFIYYKVGIAIIKNPPMMDTSLKNPWLYDPNMAQMTFEINHEHDYEVIQIDVAERGLYSVLSNYTVYYYDSDLNLIYTVLANESGNIGFSPGVFYIVSSNATDDDLTIEIKHA